MRLHTPITVVVWGRYRGGIDGEAKKVKKKDEFIYLGGVVVQQRENTEKLFGDYGCNPHQHQQPL